MREPCKVCRGIGSVVDPTFGKDGPVAWGGPLPRVPCQNCQGEGWTGQPDVRHPLIPPDLVAPPLFPGASSSEPGT